MSLTYPLNSFSVSHDTISLAKSEGFFFYTKKKAPIFKTEHDVKWNLRKVSGQDIECIKGNYVSFQYTLYSRYGIIWHHLFCEKWRFQFLYNKWRLQFFTEKGRKLHVLYKKGSLQLLKKSEGFNFCKIDNVNDNAGKYFLRIQVYYT